MTRLREIIQNPAQYLLANAWHAVWIAVLLAATPYLTWMSVVVMALISLRKGAYEGGLVLGAVIASHYLLARNPSMVMLNVVLTYMPCYIAACILRLTTSWRSVAGVFFLQIIFAMIALQLWYPEYATSLYLHTKMAFSNLKMDGAVVELLNDNGGMNQLMFANYMLGIQAVGIVFSGLIALMFARSIQSRLYYPGGFKQELLHFRGDKIALLFLTAMLFAASRGNLLAVNLLPAILFYFLLAGLSLGYRAMENQKAIFSLLLIFTPLLLFPFVALPLYVVVGALDGIFNLRQYLPNRADKRI